MTEYAVVEQNVRSEDREVWIRGNQNYALPVLVLHDCLVSKWKCEKRLCMDDFRGKEGRTSDTFYIYRQYVYMFICIYYITYITKYIFKCFNVGICYIL